MCWTQMAAVSFSTTWLFSTSKQHSSSAEEKKCTNMRTLLNSFTLRQVGQSIAPLSRCRDCGEFSQEFNRDQSFSSANQRVGGDGESSNSYPGHCCCLDTWSRIICPSFRYSEQSKVSDCHADPMLFCSRAHETMALGMVLFSQLFPSRGPSKWFFPSRIFYG